MRLSISPPAKIFFVTQLFSILPSYSSPTRQPTPYILKLSTISNCNYSQMKLSSSQFVDAIARHLDGSKPDPLVKGQINSLHVNWEEHASSGSSGDSDDAADTSSSNYLTSSFRGTLTLSSEYISIAIHVTCYWKKKLPDGQQQKQSVKNTDGDGDDVISEAKIFQEEFYIKMNACARCCEHKELKSKKLRAGMMSRLQSDHYIKRLFHGDTEGATLCEALIQQNLQTDRNGNELEERVNVEEGTLQGIKNAIFSQCEDNLDVLELLLNMPYLPRSSSSSSSLDDDKETMSNQWQCKLADRAYLRLLEDAMFDACEKEGEDELLDDLKLSGDQHYVAKKGGKEGSGVRKGGSNAKKIRKTA